MTYAPPSLLVAAPIPNPNVITSASNLSQLTSLQTQITKLTTQITQLTQTTISATTSSTTASSAARTSYQTFGGSGMSTVLDFGNFTDFMCDISGGTGPTLVLDLSAVGFQQSLTGGFAPVMQSGHIQILWPPVVGVTHTISMPLPYYLMGGSTTVNMTSQMMMYRYVIAPAPANYSSQLAVTQAQRQIYLVPVAP